MIVAYIRVSTTKQILENQEDEITRFAAQRNITIDKWVTETVSGCKKGCDRKLGSLVAELKKGDTIIVTELSRLSRSLMEIMTIVGKLIEKEVIIYSTKDKYEFNGTINSKVLCFAFGLAAEIERNLISLRTREALELRRKQGVTLGRRKGSYTKLQSLIDNRTAIASSIRSGESIISVCRMYNVSRDTFNRFRIEYLHI